RAPLCSRTGSAEDHRRRVRAQGNRQAYLAPDWASHQSGARKKARTSMTALRLVIDTNIAVSAALRPQGLQRTVLLIAISKPVTLYVSHAVLAEYKEVLARPELKIRRGLRQQLVQLTVSNSKLIGAVSPLSISSDPDDNKFLECAAAA